MPRPSISRGLSCLAAALASVAAAALASTACDRVSVEPRAAGSMTTTAPSEPRAAPRLFLYASGYAADISVFAVDAASGALTPAQGLPAFGSSPSYLAANPSVTNLYAVDEEAVGRVGAYAIDRASGGLRFLNAVSSGGRGPAFVSTDASGTFVLVANYEDGTVSVIRVAADGSLNEKVDTRSVGAEAHMIVTDPSNRFAFVPCKGVDYVAQFRFDAATGKLSPNEVPRVATAHGAGPRHIAFHPNGRLAYLINENSSTMTAFALDPGAGTLREIETQSTLPEGFSGHKEAAAVRVHPSGAWLFGSNRGDDSIVLFSIDASSGRMTRRGFVKTGGATPRDFVLDPTGTWLYAANQDSSAVVPFHFDASRGALAPAPPPASVARVPSASFVGVFGLR
jgi:6-phosphogluconolactonase